MYQKFFIVFSIVAIHYPIDRNRYFGYCESATGVGMMGGPIIGQIFYSAFGFQGCFYATSGVLLITSIISFKLIPNEINSNKIKVTGLNLRMIDQRIGDQK
jgi:MFS family permease